MYAGWAEVAGTALDACGACIVDRLRPALTPALSRRRETGQCGSSEFAVIPFLQGVEQVGGGVHLAVAFDLPVARDFTHGAVVELDAVCGVGKGGFMDPHALEGSRREAVGVEAFQSRLVGVEVDVFEVLA